MNNRDRNFTKGKIASRPAPLDAEVDRYIEEADRIDRQKTGAARAGPAARLADRHHRIRQQIERLLAMAKVLAAAPGRTDIADRPRCARDRACLHLSMPEAVAM